MRNVACLTSDRDFDCNFPGDSLTALSRVECSIMGVCSFLGNDVQYNTHLTFPK